MKQVCVLVRSLAQNVCPLMIRSAKISSTKLNKTPKMSLLTFRVLRMLIIEKRKMECKVNKTNKRIHKMFKCEKAVKVKKFSANNGHNKQAFLQLKSLLRVINLRPS